MFKYDTNTTLLSLLCSYTLIMVWFGDAQKSQNYRVQTWYHLNLIRLENKNTLTKDQKILPDVSIVLHFNYAVFVSSSKLIPIFLWK